MFEDFRLNVFVAVAEAGSFTKAAQKLGISQAAVSQNIAELERKTGVKLFDRLRREVLLTRAGEVFLKYAGKVIATYAEMQTLFAETDCATVRFSVSEDIYTACILPVLNDFLAFHPEVSVIRTDAEDYDIAVSVVPFYGLDKNTSVKFIYKPTQAFAETKTCAVLRKILVF